VWDDEEKKLREAEKGISANSVYAKKKAEAGSNGDVKPFIGESGAADVNFSAEADEAKVPLAEAAVNDGFNAELADVVAAEGVKDEEEEGEEEWYEEQRAVEWKDLSLETKVRSFSFLFLLHSLP
jgi:hypothetical protein